MAESPFGSNASDQSDVLKTGYHDNIFFEKISWDDYIFTSFILKTRFKGRFYTRKADQRTVSERIIFNEHLQDFKTIIYYCFFRKFFYIEYLLSVEFEILTDRTKGFVYLTKFYCVYATDEDEIFGVQDDDIEETRKHIFQTVEEFSIQLPYLYLGSFLNIDEFQISLSNHY